MTDHAPADTAMTEAIDPVAKAILDALDRRQAEQTEHEARESHHRQHRDQMKAERAGFLSHCRPATAMDYAHWVKGWIERGGQVEARTGVLNPQMYDFHGTPVESDPRWVVLESRPGSIPSLYGAAALHVIVPAGVLRPEELPNTFHGACGHSTFYFVDEFRAVPDARIVVTDDVRVVLMSEDPRP